MTDASPDVLVDIHTSVGEDYSLERAIEKAEKAVTKHADAMKARGYTYADVRVQTLPGQGGKYVHAVTLISAIAVEATP